MNKFGQIAEKHLFRDAVLLLVGARALRSLGIQPTTFWGGTSLGFFGGNMAGVYGFDARTVLSHIESALGGGNGGASIGNVQIKWKGEKTTTPPAQ